MSVSILKLGNARLVIKKTPHVSTSGENREASTEPTWRGRRPAPEDPSREGIRRLRERCRRRGGQPRGVEHARSGSD